MNKKEKIRHEYLELGYMAVEATNLNQYNKNIEQKFEESGEIENINSYKRLLFAEASLTILYLERVCRIYKMEKDNKKIVKDTLGPLLCKLVEDGLISCQKRKALLRYRNAFYHGNFEQLASNWKKVNKNIKTREDYFKTYLLSDIERCWEIVNELAGKILSELAK